MQVSVIIPTYNRADILKATLDGYATQTGDHRIHEILVVDDGSPDHTPEIVRQFIARSPFPVRYLRQPNLGLSAARNHAIREANGDMLLFGDDDIIPLPQLTAQHVAWHDLHPGENIGVLGYVPWSPAVNPTPFMEWSGLYGPQFNFGFFRPGQQLDFGHGYFCNTSIAASFLHKYGIFSETFRTYGYEDVELSYRLMKHGYRLLYNPEAVGHHNKFETFEDTLRRVEKLYASWHGFAETEAGQHFLSLWRAGKARPQSSLKRLMRPALAPAKQLAARLLRPMMDSHVPFPRWVYEQVFYQHVTSFADVVGDTAQSAKTAARATLPTGQELEMESSL